MHLLLGLLACKSTTGTVELDSVARVDLDGVYDPDHVVQVEIELDPADWDALRNQTRSYFDVLAGDCLAAPAPNPYTWFLASATIDGEPFDLIEVRKKGFIGSLDTERPGLKLDLNDHEDLDYLGATRLTLNNSRSDPTAIRQCLVYDLYRAAGQPASRCNLAHVWVNGEDLGVYVNVEPVKKPLLREYFDDVDGNLYEGTLSDFTPNWTGTFDKKTNTSEPGAPEVDALTDALQASGDLIDNLEPVLNVDAFMTHWAMEVLVKHQDGYAANRNNFYIYGDPSDDGRLHFIPWGTDDTLESQPWSEDHRGGVFATGMLANQLYRDDQGQALYTARMEELLDTVWDEDAILAETERWESLVLGEVDTLEAASVIASVIELREVIEDRRGEIERELYDQFVPVQDGDEICMDELGALELSFDTTWGTLNTADTFANGDAEFDLDVDAWGPLDFESFGAAAGEDSGQAIMMVGGQLSDGAYVLLYFVSEQGSFEPGPLNIDVISTWGALYYYNPATMSDWSFVSYISGELQFDEAGDGYAAPIRGSLSGALQGW